jgi:hypothetical protein
LQIDYCLFIKKIAYRCSKFLKFTAFKKATTEPEKKMASNV